jgi:hypothetical protein
MRALPMLCVPIGGSVPGRFFRFTQQWTPQGTRWEIDDTANRLDISRSILLDRAMAAGRPCWQFDADVVALQTYEEQLQLIEEDLKLGYDAVVAPHASGEGRVMVQPLYPNEMENRPHKPFAIKGGFNGAWYMSVAGLGKLKEIGWHLTSDGRKSPIYCTFGLPGPLKDQPTTVVTEDFDLAIRFREQGGKICCDPRLKVAHLNKRDTVVDVEMMDRMEAQQRANLEAYEQRIRSRIQKGEAGFG